MRKVMVSGHFDPFHYAHLDYIRKASELGDFLVAIVSSDEQVIKKKGRVNEPVQDRAEILSLILKGMDIPSVVVINRWDKDTTLVAEALRAIQPDIFCRGSDKTIEDIPPGEKEICEELGIQIVHIKGKIAHGSEFQ